MMMNKSQMTYDQLMCECENAIDDFAKSKFSLYRRLIVLKPAKPVTQFPFFCPSHIQININKLILHNTNTEHYPCMPVCLVTQSINRVDMAEETASNH